MSDLPTSSFIIQIFFRKKVWLRNTLPTYYGLDVCPIRKVLIKLARPKKVWSEKIVIPMKEGSRKFLGYKQFWVP